MNEGAFLFCLILLMMACGPQSPQNTKTSATTSASDTYRLNDEDMESLAMAKGREVMLIGLEDLLGEINQDNDQLVLYHFWSLSCPECLQMNRVLRNLSQSMKEHELKLVSVNINHPTDAVQVNTHLRAVGLTGSIYQLQLPHDSIWKDSMAQFHGIVQPDNWESLFHPSWEGNLPAILLVNPKQDINFFFNRAMDQNELMTLIDPLLLGG